MREKMDTLNPRAKLRNSVMDLLIGSVWHTTSNDRFRGIVTSGAILAEPEIAENERWGTGLGTDSYPFARHIEAVSVFDFRRFDSAAHQRRFPLSNWEEFVPYREVWGGAVWIEIDVERISDRFLSPADLLAKWKALGEANRRIMPGVEGAVFGSVPISSFQRILSISSHGIAVPSRMIT